MLIIVSVAPPPAPCEPVRGWSKKTTAKAADENTRAGDGAFDDSEGDDDDDDDDDDGDDDDDDDNSDDNDSIKTHRQCFATH